MFVHIATVALSENNEEVELYAKFSADKNKFLAQIIEEKALRLCKLLKKQKTAEKIEPSGGILRTNS